MTRKLKRRRVIPRKLSATPCKGSIDPRSRPLRETHLKNTFSAQEAIYSTKKIGALQETGPMEIKGSSKWEESSQVPMPMPPRQASMDTRLANRHGSPDVINHGVSDCKKSNSLEETSVTNLCKRALTQSRCTYGPETNSDAETTTKQARLSGYTVGPQIEKAYVSNTKQSRAITMTHSTDVEMKNAPNIRTSPKPKKWNPSWVAGPTPGPWRELSIMSEKSAPKWKSGIEVKMTSTRKQEIDESIRDCLQNNLPQGVMRSEKKTEG